MAVIEVLFEVPAHIAEGLANGTLTRFGGVIRDTKDGTIKYFLKEGQALQEAIQAGGKLPPGLDALKGMMGLQLGLQVLTLGVTVAGFVVLARKLDVIDRKLEKLAGSVAEVKDEVIWLQKVGDIERSARLAACLDDAQWREQTGRMQEIGSLRREFTEAHNAYAMLMRQMAADARSHGHHEVYQSFFHYCALAGVAKIRTDWLLDGAEAAARTQGQVAAALAAARSQFVDPMRNFEPAALMHLPSTVLPGLKRTTAIIAEDLNRVHSYGLEIEWCQRNGISLKEWDELGQGEQAPLLLVRAA